MLASRVSPAPATTTTPTTIRCHRCGSFLGESAEPMTFVGVVKARDSCDLVAPPRAIWKCKCGWCSIYVPLARTETA